MTSDFSDVEYIKFGKEGGYTNINAAFYISDKGDVYRHRFGFDSLNRIGEFSKKEFKAIQKALKNKVNFEQKYIPKSTLYYYLDWMDDTTQVKHLVWPMGTVVDSIFIKIHQNTFGIKETE